MDGPGKASIAMVNQCKLVDNEDLSLGFSQKSVERAQDVLNDYGPVLAVVVRRIEGETKYKVIHNQNIFKATTKSNEDEIPIIIAEIKDTKNEKILSLKLSMQTNDTGAIAQGALIDSLVRDDGLTLGLLSKKLGISKSWLSKRHTLARNLCDPVKDLVTRGDLPPRSAEEVAKLPGDAQHGFALKMIMENMPKDKIARLVTIHNDPATPDEVKKLVLENPSGVPLVKPAKPVKARKEVDETGKLYASLRFAAAACRSAIERLARADKNGKLPPAWLFKELQAAAKELSSLSARFLEFLSERMDALGLFGGSEDSGAVSPGKRGGRK